MSEHALAQTQQANKSQTRAKDSELLQRREGEHAEQSALQPWQIDTVSATFIEPRFGYDFSRVQALTGIARQNRPMLRTPPIVQRVPKDGASDSSSCPSCSEAESEQNATTAEPTTETAATPVASEPTEEPAEETATPGEVASPSLIVEDSATELATGQMKKSEFLSQLRTEVCRGVEAVLAGTGRTTDDCPYLNHWFDFYSRKESAHIERAIHKYAPEASNATTASGYISVIVQRARQAAETWARTSEITGVPEGVPTTVPGEAPIERGEGAETATNPVMFKAREGGARVADDPQAIQAQLGEGQPFDSGVRSRMESAFGIDFAHVRTHTDSTAVGLSDRLNARAFTVGEHIAFGSGEYRPGTMLGDALIAHEMAHVIQQGKTENSVAPMQSNEDYNTLENDADRSAISAVSSLWNGAQEFFINIAETTIPRLKTGLRLQRCQRSSSTSVTPPTITVGNFRNSGSTSPENKCSLCPQTLGVIFSGGNNFMELRGDISGHTSTAQYDFKRTKERATWKKVGATWTQTTHVGPGSSDDAHDSDEDLTPQNNHIYVIDGPGFSSLSNPAGDAAATEAVYKASFVEWAITKAGAGSWAKGSNDFEWHSISWLEKVGGTWRRKAGKSEIETGSTTVGSGNP